MQAQPALQIVPKDPTLEQEIDELGEIQRQLALAAPLVDREKVLKDKLVARLAAAPADKPVVLRGKLYELQYGTKRSERTITNPRLAFAALKKVLGAGILAVVDIPLGIIDKHVPESERSKFITKELSGWRKLDVVPLTPAQSLPPAA